MTVRLFTHPDCLRHDPGKGHPERPARLEAVLHRVRAEDLVDRSGNRVEIAEAGPSDRRPLLGIHDDVYLAQLEALSAAGGGRLTPDTMMNRDSWRAVLGATGAVLAAVEHGHGGGQYAFAAVRPPGHHALAAQGMGFCLVNHAVVAARQAQRLGRDRVLIVDWDVHHGNGTQALVETDPSLRFVSLHQHPWYPGTGLAGERGVGNVFNVPRGPHEPPERYVEDLWSAIVAATTGWHPGLVVISAGFDGMHGDPLGGFTLEPGHYAEWTRRLRERWPETPIVGVLEGGYRPERLAEGVAAHLRALVS